MKKLIIPILIFVFACETPVNPNLPDDGNGLVVYSFFRPGTQLQIDVFETSPIRKPESATRPKGLAIDLIEDDVLLERIQPNAQGEYISTIMPTQDKTYSFEIQTNDGLISASNKIPKMVPIKSVDISEIIKDINLGEYGYPAHVTLSDPVNESNFYAVEVFVEDCKDGCDEFSASGEINELLIEDVKVNISGTTDITIGAGPEFIEGARYLYFADTGFDGKDFTLDFFIIPTLLDFETEQNVAIKFVLKSISEDYYNYILTSDYQIKIEEEGTLAEPVQVSSNITNGLGVFAGYNYDLFTVRVKE